MKHSDGDTGWIKSFYDAAADWWGESWYDGKNLKDRLDTVTRYTSTEDRRILELGAGTGEMAAYFCDHGYSVLAVDISHKNIELMEKLREKRPNLRVVEGNFLDIQIDERFPIICLFEAFGLGSDRDQEQLLKRVSEELLSPDGAMILDVYHPFGPIRAAGTKQELDKLPNVPGSVDMTEYTYYDPIKSRWIDIWEPKNGKENGRIQSVRCYTPADFILLARNCGLSVVTMAFNGKEFDPRGPEIVTENIFNPGARNRHYSYLVVIRKE